MPTCRRPTSARGSGSTWRWRRSSCSTARSARTCCSRRSSSRRCGRSCCVGAPGFYGNSSGCWRASPTAIPAWRWARAYAEVGKLSGEIDSIAEAERAERLRGWTCFETLAREAPDDPEPRLGLARCLQLPWQHRVVRGAEGRSACATHERALALFRDAGRGEPVRPPAPGGLGRGSEMLHGRCDLDRPAEALEAIERARAILEAPAAGRGRCCRGALPGQACGDLRRNGLDPESCRPA